MPARRKPTHVLAQTDYFRKHPERRRARANEPAWNGPVGDAPAYFDEGLTEVWNGLKAEATPFTLAKSDRAILEMTSLLLFKLRHAPETMPHWLEKMGDMMRSRGMPARAVKRTQETLFRQIRMSPTDVRLLARCLGQMGMDPTHRLTARN